MDTGQPTHSLLHFLSVRPFLEIVDFVDHFWIGLELEASAAEAGAGATSPEQPQ